MLNFIKFSTYFQKFKYICVRYVLILDTSWKIKNAIVRDQICLNPTYFE